MTCAFRTRYGDVFLCGDLNTNMVALSAPRLEGLVDRLPVEVCLLRVSDQPQGTFAIDMTAIAAWLIERNMEWSVRRDDECYWFGFRDNVAATEFSLCWNGIY